MLKSYLEIAWRNAVTHKAYAAINISVCSPGVAASLLLFIIMKYELCELMDKLRSDYRLICYVVSKDTGTQGDKWWEKFPFAAFDAMK